MAEVKTPQDHLPKKGAPKRVTIDGVTVDLDVDRIGDDFELIMEIADLRDGDGIASAHVFKRLMGDQSKHVLDALRDPKTGIVSSERVGGFVLAAIKEVSPNS